MSSSDNSNSLEEIYLKDKNERKKKSTSVCSKEKVAKIASTRIITLSSSIPTKTGK